MEYGLFQDRVCEDRDEFVECFSGGGVLDLAGFTEVVEGFGVGEGEVDEFEEGEGVEFELEV